MMENQDKFLEELYRSYFHILEIHAYHFLGNWDDAHVAAQEAFHIACEKIDALMKSENQIGWLKNTVKNVCRHMIRDKQRQRLLLISLEELTDKDLPHEPHTLDDEVGQPTDMFEGDLPKRDLELLQKIYDEGMSYAEVAMEIDCNIWTCRKRVQRAIDKLRKKYRDKFSENFEL